MKRPNIILITADQLRWDCLGCAGRPDVRTPNIDALSAHGVRFTQAISASADCLASRVSMLMGRNPCDAGGPASVWPADAAPASLAGVLRGADYTTAAVGKTHLPRAGGAGFEVVYRAEQDGSGEDAYEQWLAEQGQVDRISEWARDGAPDAYLDSYGAMQSNLDARFHVTTWTGNLAVRFFQSAREPFFYLGEFFAAAPSLRSTGALVGDVCSGGACAAGGRLRLFADAGGAPP